MVQTLCRTVAPPQGITHCVSAYWLAPKQACQHPNLIVIRTSVLEVYSVHHHPPGADAERTDSHTPQHTLLLEHTEVLHGEVLAAACLPARRAGHRDSVVFAFDAVRSLCLLFSLRTCCVVLVALLLFAAPAPVCPLLHPTACARQPRHACTRGREFAEGSRIRAPGLQNSVATAKLSGHGKPLPSPYCRAKRVSSAGSAPATAAP